ncbi:hypothetical protein As57867_006459, partial [Aphanomyces stellatus]
PLAASDLTKAQPATASTAKLNVPPDVAKAATHQPPVTQPTPQPHPPATSPTVEPFRTQPRLHVPHQMDLLAHAMQPYVTAAAEPESIAGDVARRDRIHHSLALPTPDAFVILPASTNLSTVNALLDDALHRLHGLSTSSNVSGTVAALDVPCQLAPPDIAHHTQTPPAVTCTLKCRGQLGHGASIHHVLFATAGVDQNNDWVQHEPFQPRLCEPIISVGSPTECHFAFASTTTKTTTMVRLTAFVLLAATASAYRTYIAKFPNGDKVAGVAAIGHVDPKGDGPRNPFGLAFAAAGKEWTTALCQADSDGDGATNGQELGDPCCTWKAGEALPATFKATPPG